MEHCTKAVVNLVPLPIGKQLATPLHHRESKVVDDERQGHQEIKATEDHHPEVASLVDVRSRVGQDGNELTSTDDEPSESQH